MGTRREAGRVVLYHEKFQQIFTRKEIFQGPGLVRGIGMCEQKSRIGLAAQQVKSAMIMKHQDANIRHLS